MTSPINHAAGECFVILLFTDVSKEKYHATTQFFRQRCFIGKVLLTAKFPKISAKSNQSSKLLICANFVQEGV